MRFLFSNKPKIKQETTKSESYSGWLKCPSCKELIHTNEVEKNLNCCAKCDHHYRQTARQRLQLIADHNSFEELFTEIHTADPLHFVDAEPYAQRIESA